MTNLKIEIQKKYRIPNNNTYVNDTLCIYDN